MNTKPLSPLLAIAVMAFYSGAAHAQADWVHRGPDGRLVYKSDANGNRVMDFSTAGYMGGGVALPEAETRIRLAPSGKDDQAALQNAINQVAGMPLQNGLRGAVELSAGTFRTGGPVNINASGIVVRGAGPGAGGTVILASGGSLFHISGSGDYATGAGSSITDDIVPSGATSVNVENSAGFAVGDNVLVSKPVTAAWVASMGMDKLFRNGGHQTWISVGTRIITDRTITAISGKTLTFDGPLTDCFDSRLLGKPVGTVSKYAFAGRIRNSGLESLKIIASARTSSFESLEMSAAMDCWAKDVAIEDGINCLHVQKNVRRATFLRVSIAHTINSTAVAAPADFACQGTQILFDRCRASGSGSWSWVTQALGTGPMVTLNFKTPSGISPHQRWTTGILADGDTAGIAFRNRNVMGSGHGWTTGWSVAWNVTGELLVSNAPGSINWAIGGKGSKTSIAGDPDGIYDHFGTMVEPRSLYLSQLKERLGPQALANIGYGETGTAIRNPAARTSKAGIGLGPVSHIPLIREFDRVAPFDTRFFLPNGKRL